MNNHGIFNQGIISQPSVVPLEIDYYFDNFATDTAIACSLRQLSSSDTQCVRVRRASDNSEQDIGFDVTTGMVDISSLESFCSGTDGFVVTWYGQGPSAFDYEQGTQSYQPQIVGTGSVLTQDGYPYIKFDGTNDYLYSTNDWTGSYSYYCVHKANSLVTHSLFGNDGNRGCVIQGLVTGAYRFAFRGVVNRDTTTGLLTSTDRHLLIAYVENSTQMDAYQDGSDVSPAATSAMATNVTNGSFIGCYASTPGGLPALPWNGRMSEVIVYDYADDTNYSSIESHINNWWTIY